MVNADLDDADIRQSEGNILEVSGRKRRQEVILRFQGLGEEELGAVNSKLKKLDLDAPSGALFSKKVDLNYQMAGKKRPRKETDSFVSDEDACELGDEDFFYGCGAGTINPNMIIKLNPQEEEDLIRELQNQAIENDPLKELDEALMDRTTA